MSRPFSCRRVRERRRAGRLNLAETPKHALDRPGRRGVAGVAPAEHHVDLDRAFRREGVIGMLRYANRRPSPSALMALITQHEPAVTDED